MIKFFSFCIASLFCATTAVAYDQALRPYTDLDDYVNKYCNRFQQIPYGSIGSTMKEMEATRYSLAVYFSTPACQSDRYSEAVGSPLMHIIVDNAPSRERFLEFIYKYFLLVKRQPDEFTTALNATNTKGESVLDYIETLKATEGKNYTEQLVVYERFIRLACTHGGRYLKYGSSDERCRLALYAPALSGQ